MIVETLANEFYSVTETNDVNLAHVWFGVPVKKTKDGYVPKAKARQILVRKQGCKVVA
jgi:hypothetical protein